MCENKKKHVHFMGICGSGCASIAMLAADAGFTVSGCDQSDGSYYAGELKKKGIQIFVGHDKAHLTEDVDIVAVSPAIFDVNPDNEELLLAKEKGILMTWQEFMGRFLQEGRRVVAISGTHGKTTTTFLTGELLIDAGLDPNVLGGSVYKKWGNGGRSGSSNLFVCEADEFNRNFYHYKPEIAVLNNVEMDHPECYNNFEEVLEAFTNFVTKGGKLKKLLLNADSEGAVEVLRRASLDPAFTDVEVYAITRNKDIDFSQINHKVNVCIYYTDRKDENGTGFSMELLDKKYSYDMKLYGEYNVQNAVTAIMISKLLDASEEKISASIKEFSGVGRRFDKVGTFKNVPVFDDYAHHPTEISSVLQMTRDYFPDKKVLAVFEPHQVSRLRLMFQGYVDALTIADHIVITKTHMGREIHKGVVPISKDEWYSASEKMYYEEDYEAILPYVSEMIDKSECDLVVVIGAANSYKISKLLVEA